MELLWLHLNYISILAGLNRLVLVRDDAFLAVKLLTISRMPRCDSKQASRHVPNLILVELLDVLVLH
jgi:hypothetical protein